jgi:transmembrane sensor
MYKNAEMVAKTNSYKAKFRKLTEKYLSLRASDNQKEALDKYYGLFDSEPDQTESLDADELSAIESRIKAGIAKKIYRREPIVFTLFRHPVFRAAGILLLVSCLSLGIYYYYLTTPSKPDVALRTISIEPSQSNHFVILPDGSKALLRKGSQMTYDKDFNTLHREINLTGEAYFDIAHVTYMDRNHRSVKKPFIIHTGKVKTTVLGTAFEIKAWPESEKVIVSVTRGKVRVEDENHLIAVLNKDDQVDYDLKTTEAIEGDISKQSEFLSWAKEDMVFDNMPFETLAERLGKRYQVTIVFKKPDLKQCRFTGRFSGTETLEEVIQILTVTSHTTYAMEGNRRVVIDGRKCD